MEILPCIYLTLLGVFSELINFATSDGPGWLQVCSDSGTWKIYAGGCPRGIWLTGSPINVSCVCVNGVWAVTKSACDDTPFLLVGRGHDNCFSLNTQIDTFKYIGKPSDPFAAADFVGTSFLGVFWKMPSGKGSRDHRQLNGSVAMISINSDNIVEAKGQICCRKGMIDSSSGAPKPVGICLAQHGKSYKAQEWCSEGIHQGPYTFELDYGQGLQIQEYTQTNNQLAFDKSTILNCDTDCKASCGQSVSPDSSTDCCQALDFEDIDEEAAVDQKRINEQTGRIASNFIQLKLWKKKGKVVKHPEYIYFKMAKKIMAKICPNTNMSTYLLNAVMHLFRYLLTETMDRYPLIKRFEERRHKRILQGLANCLAQASSEQPMKFEWSTTDVCPPQIESVSITTKDGKTTKISRPLLPDNQTFSYLHYDFPLEAAWKIISFTHYYCANQFSAYPSDHSQLLISLESFYNAELLQRWVNPGKSYEAFKRVFNMYQLPRFIAGLDACVAGSRSASEYKQWITRPLTRRYGPPPHLAEEKVFDGKGYCLSSYWDPAMKPESAGDSFLHPTSQVSCYPDNTQFYRV